MNNIATRKEKYLLLSIAYIVIGIFGFMYSPDYAAFILDILPGKNDQLADVILSIMLTPVIALAMLGVITLGLVNLRKYFKLRKAEKNDPIK